MGTYKVAAPEGFEVRAGFVGGFEVFEVVVFFILREGLVAVRSGIEIHFSKWCGYDLP